METADERGRELPSDRGELSSALFAIAINACKKKAYPVMAVVNPKVLDTHRGRCVLQVESDAIQKWHAK